MNPCDINLSEVSRNTQKHHGIVSNTITLTQYCNSNLKKECEFSGGMEFERRSIPLSLCVCWVTCSSEQESDGWGEREDNTHRPGMEIDWATATELQHCRLEQCNNKEQQQKQRQKQIQDRDSYIDQAFPEEQNLS